MSKRLNHLTYLLLFLGTMLVFTSCGERTVEPFDDLEGFYSVYGAFSVNEANQYVRIRRLDTPLLADSSAFNGSVEFENLSNGMVEQLEDTVVEFNGNYTHNFLVEATIQPSTSYRLSVEDDEGNRTESTFTTPALTSSVYSPSSSTDIKCNTPVRIVLSNFEEPEKVLYEIGFRHDGRMNWERIDLFRDEIAYSYANNSVALELSPHNFLVEVFTPPLPDNPYLDPFDLNPTVSCFELDQKEIFIRYYHLGSEWNVGLPNELPPLDIETEIIENGLGFLGGYHTEEIRIPFTL